MTTTTETRLVKGMTQIKCPFQGLSTETWKEIKNNGEFLNIQANSILFKKGDPTESVYMLVTGYLGIYQNNKCIDIIEPAQTLGAGLIQIDSPKSAYPISCISLTNTVIIKIKSVDIIKLISKYSDLNLYFYKQIQIRMHFLQLMQIYSKSPVPLRVAILMKEKKHLFQFKFLTRRLISEILSTTTESVIRTTSFFLKENIISMANKRLNINDKINDFIESQNK